MRFPAHPLILGHRGAPREAPENTLRAFRLAREHGADGVELDVQPSADGVPVVIHDPTLDRTTDSRGAVASLPWERLAAVRSGAEPLARLETVAEWAAESGAWLNVEIKSAGIEAESVTAIEAVGLIPRAFFSSFLPEVVARVGEVAPHAVRFLLTEDWSASVLATARELGVSGVCLHHPLATSTVLAELRAASLDAVVWTVDDSARIHELLHAGVRAIITNDPARAVTMR